MDKELNAHFERFNKNLSSLVSLRDSFIRGLITGIGTAIGATVIAGALLALGASILSNSDNIPVLKEIVDIFRGDEV